jgi:hypothetical protein
LVIKPSDPSWYSPLGFQPFSEPASSKNDHLERDVDAYRREGNNLQSASAEIIEPTTIPRQKRRQQQGIGRYMTLMGELGKQAAGKNHLVASVRIDQSLRRSLQAHHARKEGDQHDAQHCSGSHRAKRIGQNGRHWISKRTVDNRADIDHGHNQRKADESSATPPM